MRTHINSSRTVVKMSTLAVAGLLGLGLAANAVSATLKAEAKNTTAHGISSGTLKLTQAKNGVGFDTTIADMAPGDVVNRYVDYTNNGTLASQELRLKVDDSTSPKSLLSTDSAKGLQLVVKDCSSAWNPTAGTCSGASTTLLTSPISALTSDTAFSNITTLAANSGILHLQFALTLPEATETTTNGTLTTGSIQGLAAALTWTLSETQRTATNTNA